MAKHEQVPYNVSNTLDIVTNSKNLKCTRPKCVNSFLALLLPTVLLDRSDIISRIIIMINHFSD